MFDHNAKMMSGLHGQISFGGGGGGGGGRSGTGSGSNYDRSIGGSVSFTPAQQQRHRDIARAGAAGATGAVVGIGVTAVTRNGTAGTVAGAATAGAVQEAFSRSSSDR